MPPPKDPIKYAEYCKKKSESMKGKYTGVNNPMYGRKGILAPGYGKTGELNPMYGKTCELNPFFGKEHTIYTRQLMINNHYDCKGENHPNWKGGITPNINRIRNSKEYKQWRNNCFKRDNYTCQNCLQSISNKMNAHHLFNFADYPDSRLDIDNGICLCNSCHKQFHSIYGNNDTTPYQIIDFINKEQ